jgi:hypothetical protein
MSASKKGNSGGVQPTAQTIEVLGRRLLETGKKTIYPSIGEAARALNITQPIITMYFIRNQYQKKP